MSHKLVSSEMTPVEFSYYRRYLNSNWRIGYRTLLSKHTCMIGAGTFLAMTQAFKDFPIDQVVWSLKVSESDRAVCRNAKNGFYFIFYAK